MKILDVYPQYDGLGLAELVRTRQVRPAELVEAAIARIEACNPALNAVVLPLYDQALAAAGVVALDTPFAGVPLLLKDFWTTCAGVPTSEGNRVLRRIPRARDSEMVRRFRAAGLLIVGKTNTPELALMPSTEPETFGPTRNPWRLDRTPGGSSGGSAAAVAARMTPMGGATDGGGSIRMPASCCGLFGMKPTRGRSPSGPERLEMWRGLGVEYVISRSVRDSAAMLDAVAGPEPGNPQALPMPAGSFLAETTAEPGRLRIAFSAEPLIGSAKAHPDCVRALAETVRLLEDLGHELVEASPGYDRRAAAVALMRVVAAEADAEVAAAGRLAGRRLGPDDLDPVTMGMALIGRSLDAATYTGAWRLLDQVALAARRFAERYDLFLTPTLARPPVPLGHFAPTSAERTLVRLVGRLGAGWVVGMLDVVDRLAAEVYGFMPYTPLFNISGQPAMSVPLAWNGEGLPIGMQFAARFGDEATLLRLAGQLERARPWANRWPPACGV